MMLALAGCGGGAVSAQPTAAVLASPSAQPAPTPVATPKASNPTKAPSPTPPNSAPPELLGSWELMLVGAQDEDPSATEQVTLDIAEHSYRVHRGPILVGGKITVRGDEIEFSHSTLCEGRGTYRWTLAPGSLTFTPIQEDECHGRAEYLDDQTFTKAP